MMPKKEVPPTPGATGAGADEINAMAGQYSQGAAKASGKPLPWYANDTGEWFRASRGLKANERGVLADIWALIHDERGPISDDPKRLSLTVGLGPSAVKKVLQTLDDVGAIVRRHGLLMSPYMYRELKRQREKSKTMGENSSRRSKKGKQKQLNDLSEDHTERVRDTEERSGAHAPDRSSAAKSVAENNELTDLEMESVGSAPSSALDAPSGAVTASQALEILETGLQTGALETPDTYRAQVERLADGLRLVALGEVCSFLEQANHGGMTWFGCLDWDPPAITTTPDNDYANEDEDRDDIPY